MAPEKVCGNWGSLQVILDYTDGKFVREILASITDIRLCSFLIAG
jgi:hypothetical protein